MTVDTQAQIEAAERAVWEALVTGDASADRDALTEDFLGVYPSGFATREDHVAQLSDGPSILSYALSDITVRQLAPEVALISYRAGYTRNGAPEAVMYVSSIWERRDGRWRNSFSMDSPAN